MPTEEARRTARLATYAFAGLAIATLAAFFLSSILKSQPNVLEGIERLKFFSPNGDGRDDVQTVRFTMDEADTISVDVVDVDNTRIARVLEDRKVKRGDQVTVRWDGIEDDGSRAPDGEYGIRVALENEGRSILAPRPFILDTKPLDPVVTVDAEDAVVAPGTPVDFTARRTGTIEAPSFTVVRTDSPEREVVRRIGGEAGREEYLWDGNDDTGEPVPPGTYLIRVSASDPAGNVAEVPAFPLRAGEISGRPGVTVRELAVQPPVTPARAGGFAAFKVDSRRRPYRWKLRRVGDPEVLRKGVKARGRPDLTVKVPFGPSGVYLLEVTTRTAKATVPLAVQARIRKPLLLVLPMISWLGQSPVDVDRDGLPDTFANNTAVPFPRLFGYPTGLPTGIARDVGPLLAFLDDAGYNYDLTTDLALARDEEPTDERPGVLFLGAPQWISPPVAEHLRGYVEAGGRVALFGPRALRSAVRIGDRRLDQPTPPAPEDALGGRVANVRALDPGVPLVVFAEDDPGLGLFEGFAGELAGFTEVEELVNPGSADLIAGVGEESTDLEPAFSGVRLGDGLVIRIGLPEWVPKLKAEDPNVLQLTYNVIDVLRGAHPRARAAN